MPTKPPYEELEESIKDLKREVLQGKRTEEELKKVVTALHSF